MKNVSHKKKWNAGTVQVHMDTPPIPLIKSKNGDKSDKAFFTLNFVGIRRQKIWISMNLKWTCLITEIQRSSCFSSVISACLLMRQE